MLPVSSRHYVIRAPTRPVNVPHMRTGERERQMWANRWSDEPSLWGPPSRPESRVSTSRSPPPPHLPDLSGSSPEASGLLALWLSRESHRAEQHTRVTYGTGRFRFLLQRISEHAHLFRRAPLSKPVRSQGTWRPMLLLTHE